MADQNSINYDDEEEEYSIMAGNLPKDAVVPSGRCSGSDLSANHGTISSRALISLNCTSPIKSLVLLLPLLLTTERIIVVSGLISFCSIFILLYATLNNIISLLTANCLYLFSIDDAKDQGNFEFCYNGLICLTKDIYNSPVVILWNPATRRFKCINIPSECSRFTYLKLGYHQQSNEYKILRVPFQTRSNDESSKMAWIYTLSSGSWKTVPFTLLSLTVAWGPQISLNGFVYWLASGAVEYIICFDLIKDEFKLLNVPDDRGFDPLLVHRRLMILRGSLSMMVYIEDGSRDTEIWMLVNKSSGVQPYSWTKKFIIEPFSKETSPLGMWNADKLLIKVLQTHALKQVYSYDLVTKKIDYFHVPKEQDLASFLSVCGRYFESLELEGPRFSIVFVSVRALF